MGAIELISRPTAPVAEIVVGNPFAAGETPFLFATSGTRLKNTVGGEKRKRKKKQQDHLQRDRVFRWPRCWVLTVRRRRRVKRDKKQKKKKRMTTIQESVRDG